MSLIKSEKTEKNVYTLEFSVDKETFDKAVNSVYRKQVAKIAVPGFRKGKAPRSVIEKMYGKGFFYEDAVNAVLPDASTQLSRNPSWIWSVSPSLTLFRSMKTVLSCLQSLL